MLAPKRLRFTKRKNGKSMCTLTMHLHVDEALVDMVSREMGCTRAEAATTILREVSVEMSDRLSWRTPVVQQACAGEAPKFSIRQSDSIDDIEAAAEQGRKIVTMPDCAAEYLILVR